MPTSGDERGPVDLLADEFLARHRRGEQPTIREYSDRHPELADDIRDVFEALLMVEDLKPGAADVSGSFGDSVQVNDKRLERVGDYQILREVGRGGMGVVYEAQQVSLGRHVALKVLASYALLDPRHLGRFQREARAAARLHHTNIVPVYGVGEQDGLHYYVMQYITGLGLDAVLVELQRLRQPAIAQQNEPRLPTKGTGDVSAVEVAQTLLMGECGPSAPASPPRAGRPEAKPIASAPGDVGASTSVPKADSSATIFMPGQTEGSTLTESGRQYWQSVARVGMQVAGALEHAASQGILHRDIKPSNLLLDEQGNVWVTDFGLAKADSDADNLTHTGDIVGTFRYMAPERFNGEGDVRSDVYSLGLTLYELLTLRPAFDESDRNKLVKQVMHDEPDRPRKLNRAVPPDLETIVLKAIARDPTQRYQTPVELADDLQRFVEDRPIRARRVSESEKLRRWCRRNPLPASLVAGMVLVFLTGFAGVFWQWLAAEEARKHESTQRQRADALRQGAELARDDAKAQEVKAVAEKERAEREEAKAKAAEGRTAAALYGSSIVRAQLQYRANNVTDAEDTLDHCDTERRGWEWHFLKHLCHADLVTLHGHTSWVYAVAYSPDGRLLASAGGGNPFWETPQTGGIRPGEVILWDAATGARLGTLEGHKNVITCLAFSPDGKTLATGSQDDTVSLWDPTSGKPLRVLPGRSTLPPRDRGAGVSSEAFSPDGKLLAVGLYNRIDIWDMARPLDAPLAPRATLPGLSGHWAAGMAFSPDGLRLAVAHRRTWTGEVKVWDLARGVEAVTLAAPTGVANAVAISPDGRYLTATLEGGARVWDAATGNLLQTLGGGIDRHAGVFSPAGDRFAAGSSDGVVRIWSIPGGEEINLFRGHRAEIRGIAFSPDGESLASASADGTVKLWDLAQDSEHGRLDTGDMVEVEAIAFADDGKRLVVAQRGGITRTRECDSDPSWKLLPAVALSQTWLTPAEPACLDAEGVCLAGISQEDARIAKCWEVATGREQATLRGHQQDLWIVTINPGGTRVATAGYLKEEPLRSEIKVWDAVSGRPLFQLDEANLHATRLALSPTGDRLAVAGLRVEADGEDQEPSVKSFVRIYHVDSAQVLRDFVVPVKVEGGYEKLLALAFSADGTRLAAAGIRRTVLLWDLSAERPALSDRGPELAMDLTFSPDGRRLAIASQLQVRLLDAASGEQVLTLLGRKHLTPDKNGFNPRVRFSPDGRRLVAICHDTVWPLALWSVDKESGQDPAVRLRAAVQRAIATHLGLASAYAHDPKKQTEFAFHLKQLKDQELTTAEEYAVRGALYQNAGQPEAAEADFARAWKLAPDDPAVLFKVGTALAAGNHWDKAAPFIDRYITLGRGDPAYTCAMANLPLYLNDRATFQRYTQQLLDRYGQSKDSRSVLNLLMWVVLMEEQAADPKLLVQMADRLLADTTVSPHYVIQVKAMAEYRAGHLEAAVEWLRKADQQTTWLRYKAVISFFLSMAYQRLNRSDEAKAAFQQGLAHVEKGFGSLDRYQPGQDDWFGWTWCQILRREAESVLNIAKGPEKKSD